MASKNTSTRSKSVETKTETTVKADEPVQEERKRYTPKAFDPNQVVVVRNGFQGPLVYRSKKTGERFRWDAFNAEQDMEIAELRSARNTNKKYFINNWWMFDDPEIVEYLGMSQYYKFALGIKDFDKLFEKDASEIADVISKLSAGQRKSVIYRAKQMIADGAIDSNRVISTLEKCLGVELIER